MNALDFAILALAAWRVTILLAIDDGPWRVLDRLRAIVNPRTTVLECPYCTGIWIGWLVWLLWLLWPVLTVLVCVPLAIAAVICFLHQMSYDHCCDEDPPPPPLDEGESMLSG